MAILYSLIRGIPKQSTNNSRKPPIRGQPPNEKGRPRGSGLLYSV